MITSGEGKYKVWLKKYNIGEDKIYILEGGEKPHIGGLVICEPDNKIKVIKFKNHYDYIVLKIISEEVLKKINTKTIVTGGIHIDNATKKEIDIIIDNCRRLAKCI